LHDTFSTPTALAPTVTTVAAANSSSLEKLAVAAFNAGEGRVAAAQERAQKAGLNPALYLDVESYLPQSTQEYVQKVLKLKTSFESLPLG
jgi:membrane-bound lytic murein transglycosylase MltF